LHRRTQDHPGAAGQRAKRSFTVSTPTSGRSTATWADFPRVQAGLADALRQHRARQVEERLAAGEKWREQDFIFTTLLGTPLEGTRVTKDFQKVLAKAGLTRMKFHELRHSYVSLLGAQGVPPRTIQATMGHSQMSTTMNIYAHVMPSMLRDAADAMDRALS
jgi:integrase